MKTHVSQALTLSSALAALLCAPIVLAAPGLQPCRQVDVGPVVHLAVGKSTLYRPPTPITRLLVGNPDNAVAARPSENTAQQGTQRAPVSRNPRPGAADVDVLLLNPSEIYLLGKTVGATNLVFLDRSGACNMLEVVVGLDTTALKASLQELLPAETGLRISAAADSLVLAGRVSDAAVADQVVSIAEAFVRDSGDGPSLINLMEVASPQQVMLEVKVAEISKSLLDQFDANITSNLRLKSLLDPLGIDIDGARSLFLGRGTYNPQGNIASPLGKGELDADLSIDMQKQDGLVKILAEPNVMAISGQEGSFLAGGKIFIPVPDSNDRITLEEREFGVSLKFTPTVLAGGRINLKVNPEVSELNAQGVALGAPGINGSAILPSFTTRRASTTVQLMDGQSFAIGGLIKNNVSSNIKALPYLGEVPILGALFRSTSFQNDRSELVFIITPRLVKPLPANHPLPTDAYSPPSRYDLILGGKLEASRSAKTGRSDEPAPASDSAPD